MSGVAGLVKIPELRKKIIFSLIVLAVYRLGVHIPTPGIDANALEQLFSSMQGTVFGIFNMFTGGAFERFSILALGVMPYISSSIIMQLLTVTSPYLSDLQKEGDHGRKKITQYTRYGTVVLCIIQGWGIASGLENYAEAYRVVLNPGLSFKLMTALTLTTGTVFLMWLGEQISERGIGNGISLIIFAGIASGIPGALGSTINLARSGELKFFSILALILIALSIFFIIIYVERASRRIPVHYAKRIVGRKIYGGQNTHLPLKVNTAGVIPPIFASSLIMMPATIATIFPSEKVHKFAAMLQPGAVIYNILFVGLIVFFCFFYTSVVFKTDDVADNLKKYGGFVPGIRPGPATAEYINYVLTRITFGGAIYISAICVVPHFLIESMGVPQHLSRFLGGTSVLIMVGVAMDTLAQIETFLLQRSYDGFMKHTRIKGRRAFT